MKAQLVVCCALFGVIACAGALAVTADSTYGGQQLSCEQRAASKAEARSCRDQVDKQWCVVDGAPMCVPEGGLDQ